jgi:hypothetical protein
VLSPVGPFFVPGYAVQTKAGRIAEIQIITFAASVQFAIYKQVFLLVIPEHPHGAGFVAQLASLAAVIHDEARRLYRVRFEFGVGDNCTQYDASSVLFGNQVA